MDDTTWAKLRPEVMTTAAISEAMVWLHEETSRAADRLEELKAQRAELLLRGTSEQLRQHAAAIAELETDLERLSAIGAELDRQLKLARDAEAAGIREQQFLEAAAAIEKSNEWFNRNYLKHAHAIAEGLKLEQHARSLLRALARGPAGRWTPPPEGLPKLAQAYVGGEGRDFSYLVKLPGIEPGDAVHWTVPQPTFTGEAAAYYRSAG